jgi:heat shock protein HslJ
LLRHVALPCAIDPAEGDFDLRTFIERLLPIPLFAALAACSAAPPVAAPSTSLAGTSWELVRFQSMDDAQGAMQIADPSLYTISFHADGGAALRVNCNRAQGSWLAVAAPDGRSGTLTFGPIAGTRARCPPPSLDEKVLRDLAYVRGYLLRDGQLHMSLFADGGIYSWRPARP